MSWIDDEIMNIKNADARRSQEERAQQVRDSVLRTKAPHFFSTVVQEVNRNIQTFVSAFQERPDRQIVMTRIDDTRFRITGGGRHVDFYLDGHHAISYKAEGPGIVSGPPQAIDLVVDADDKIETRNGGSEAVARILLTPITSVLREKANR
jgi:hypothetical protein